MRTLICTLLVVAALTAQSTKSALFMGVITDSECARADHSVMKMGSTDAECVRACVDSHGAEYVLYDGKSAYMLSDQKTAEKFAGQKVTVSGRLDAKGHTIQTDSIAAAK